jgi:3-deoxy-manno-octulosonate cytidylyltransferase (CMP-KDO synthetase)
MTNISIIIPARYDSSRFPGKPLAKISGKEMILRVCDICAKVLEKKNIYVATDDKRISTVVKNSGYKFIKTSKNCLTGTDRVYHASKKINSKIIINVQGDEPIINSLDIKKIINAKKKFPNHVICGFNEVYSSEAISKNIPKVVFKKNFDMLYISRALIPSNKSKKIKNKIFKQVCIYGFNKKQLYQYGSQNRKSYLEKIEDIELLRFFDLNIPIKMIKVSDRSIAVDIKSDIKKVETFLKNEKN